MEKREEKNKKKQQQQRWMRRGHQCRDFLTRITLKSGEKNNVTDIHKHHRHIFHYIQYVMNPSFGVCFCFSTD